MFFRTHDVTRDDEGNPIGFATWAVSDQLTIGVSPRRHFTKDGGPLHVAFLSHGAAEHKWKPTEMQGFQPNMNAT